MKVIDKETGKPFSLNSTPELAADLDRCGQFLNCPHANQEIRRFVDAGGASHMKRQCVDCGVGVGTSIAKAVAPKEAPAWDRSLYNRIESRYLEERSNIIQKHVTLQKRRVSSWQKRYDGYLRSPEWAEVRCKVFQRSNGLCEGCRNNEAKEVHHLSYDHMGKEFIFELVAVCSQCHERLHLAGCIESPCCDCVSGENDECLKFELPLAQALAAEGPCGPNRDDFEPYK